MLNVSSCGTKKATQDMNHALNLLPVTQLFLFPLSVFPGPQGCIHELPPAAIINPEVHLHFPP